MAVRKNKNQTGSGSQLCPRNTLLLLFYFSFFCVVIRIRILYGSQGGNCFVTEAQLKHKNKSLGQRSSLVVIGVAA